MIQVFIDHSHEDDYYMISTINVELSSPSENERVNKLIKELELDSKFVNGFDDVASLLAELLTVDKNQIDIEVIEIDIM